MMHRCCHNNSTPFQSLGGGNTHGGITVGSVRGKPPSAPRHRRAVSCLCSDAGYWARARQLFPRGPGLKCQVTV
ncbi:uncharacterized protein ACO6RY_08145 [Pungitius sinensis]